MEEHVLLRGMILGKIYLFRFLLCIGMKFFFFLIKIFVGSCICSVGYKGKKCQEMEFCQVQDCPTGSECRNLNHGYECVANITLHEPIFVRNI